MATASSDITSNPGTVLASKVDAEVAKFRELQETINKLRSDFQTLLSQNTENEMVLSELKLAANNSNVYKLVGPVLLKQDAEEAIQTVQKRLEFIRGEQAKLQRLIQDTEQQGQTLASTIQKMQAGLQQATAQAVQAIAAQHNQSKQ